MGKKPAKKATDAAAPAGGPKPIVLIAAILGLSVIGAGVGFFAATSLGGGDAPMEEAHAPEPAHAAPAADEGGHGEAAAPKSVNEMAVTPFKEIIVNISATTATGRVTTRFMKLNVALVYDETLAGADRIEERRLFIRDSFQDYLRLLTEQDLRGSLGLVVVKQELLHRARTVTESLAPQEILVADLIVQ